MPTINDLIRHHITHVLAENAIALKVLNRALSSRRILEDYNAMLDEIADRLSKGHSVSTIRKDVQARTTELPFLLEVAASRLRVKDKFTRWERVWLDRYSSQYSTPEIVGKYRAGLISEGRLVDIGCGSGMQAVMFAERREVTGIENNPIRSRMAKLNAGVYEVSMEVIGKDFHEVSREKLGKRANVFSDPVRTPRAVKDPALLNPSPEELMHLYGDIAEQFIFDLPPRTDPMELGWDGTYEYMSVQNVHSRLTFYSSSERRIRKRCVLLPSGRTFDDSRAGKDISRNLGIPTFVLLPDESIVRSGLLGMIDEIDQAWEVYRDKRRMVLGCDKPLHGFPGDIFEVEDSIPEQALDDSIKRSGYRIIPRFEIDPDRFYDRFPNEGGNAARYAFKAGDTILIARKREIA